MGLLAETDRTAAEPPPNSGRTPSEPEPVVFAQPGLILNPAPRKATASGPLPTIGVVR